MTKTIAATLLILISATANAFQCPKDHEPELEYAEAESVYVARINSVEFYQDINDGKDAKLLLAKFSIQETLKGESKEHGEVTDLVGIGTGFVNFIPGLTYILAIRKKPADYEKDHIDLCNILGMAFDVNDKELQETIKKLKSSGSGL
ncbi:hypothetical protein HNP49_003096 [Pseudomonas fluvialis]|uniref:Uncharacterized protein n=1 Tax=Pseudomonas fluvialis TaxID=1793966 RepID=A0A7X0BUQ9_9PSED|nr:hypothetical protein [Pseudomonas fluvialis]MBB6342908.1 hypothetical protein [Pseudomonas fluvialis]